MGRDGTRWDVMGRRDGTRDGIAVETTMAGEGRDCQLCYPELINESTHEYP